MIREEEAGVWPRGSELRMLLTPPRRKPRVSLRPVSQAKGATASPLGLNPEAEPVGDEKGAACCGGVSFFMGTLISPGQPQGREEEQNSFSSTDELGGLDSPEGSLSLQWLLNPGAQQSSGCHSSTPPGPASSEAEHASQEAHTHRSMYTSHTEPRAVLWCSFPALITVFQYLKATTKTTETLS